MKTGFDASVPARKPKTQIGRVLTELTARSAAPADEDVDGVEEIREPEPRAAEPVRAAIALHQDQPVAPAAVPAKPSVTTEWDRLAALRERLAQAAQPRTTASEPQHTAAAVRKLIDELRARLDAAVKERADVVLTLENTRTALAQAEAQLERERRSRAAIEVQAEERGQVAAQAVAEAEALAAERDLVLSELAERRRLEHEQTAILAEAEAAFNRHNAENQAAARQVSELRELLEVRGAEVADLEDRLKAEAAERGKVESRCRELEAEVTRLAQAAEVLEAINAMVRP